MAGVQAQVLSLPPCPSAGLRLRPGLQPPHGPSRPLLCPHAQPAQLLRIGESSVRNPVSRASMAATAILPRYGPAPCARRTCTVANSASGPSKPLSSKYGRHAEPGPRHRPCVWYLNDPVEDNPDHDWEDYRVNWESTLVASLFQPAVWRYEVAPWPERIFAGNYRPQGRLAAAASYSPGLRHRIAGRVMNRLERPQPVPSDVGFRHQRRGRLVGDSLMFQRGDP